MATIGAAARLSGVRIVTIRYYEHVGLIEPPARTSAGRREYEASDIQKLRLIKQCRELGFEMPAIRRILDLFQHPEAPCSDMTHLVEEQVAAVEDRIRKLSELRDELSAMQSRCRSNRVADCRIIESIIPALPSATRRTWPRKAASSR
jgi:DNA-binding transcriptional MerR regulator